jgi:hypothetical protein
MLLAAKRGNYSAQVAYSSFALGGRLSEYGAIDRAQVRVFFLDAAKPLADGFFETLLIDSLGAQLGATP